jgi:hypothetical protein
MGLLGICCSEFVKSATATLASIFALAGTQQSPAPHAHGAHGRSYNLLKNKSLVVK